MGNRRFRRGSLRRAVRLLLCVFRLQPQKGLGRGPAESITLTPGTITVHSEGDRLTVHCLDTQFMEGIDDTSFSQALEKMQKTKEEEA